MIAHSAGLVLVRLGTDAATRSSRSRRPPGTIGAPAKRATAGAFARRIGTPVPGTRLVPVDEIAGLPDDVATADKADESRSR